MLLEHVKTQNIIFTKIKRMKRKKLLTGLVVVGVATAVATVIASKVAKKNKAKKYKRLDEIADEGYETAHDILFPGKRKEKRELRYGPVLPL